MTAKKKAAVKRKAPAKKKAAVKRNPAKRAAPKEIYVVYLDMPDGRKAYFSGYDQYYQMTFDDDIGKAKKFDMNAAIGFKPAVIASLRTPKITKGELRELAKRVKAGKKR